MSDNPAFKSHTDTEWEGNDVMVTDRHVYPNQLAWEATLAALTGLLAHPDGAINGAAQAAVEVGRETAELFCIPPDPEFHVIDDQ